MDHGRVIKAENLARVTGLRPRHAPIVARDGLNCRVCGKPFFDPTDEQVATLLCGTCPAPAEPTLSGQLIEEVTDMAEEIDRIRHGEIIIKVQDGRPVLTEITNKYRSDRRPDPRGRVEHR